MITTIYRESLAALRANLLAFVVFGALLWGAETLMPQKGAGTGLSLFLWAAFSFGLYRYFLFGDPMTRALIGRRGGMARSEWRYGLVLLAFIAAAIALTVVAAIPASGLWAGQPQDLQLTIYALLFLVCYFVMLVLFGSAMPAFVAGDRFGVQVSLSRVRKSAGPVFLGLLLGPVAFLVVSVGIWAVVNYFLHLPTDSFDAGGQFSPLGMVFDLMFRGVGLFQTTLATAALTEGYRRSSDFMGRRPADADALAAIF